MKRIDKIKEICDKLNSMGEAEWSTVVSEEEIKEYCIEDEDFVKIAVGDKAKEREEDKYKILPSNGLLVGKIGHPNDKQDVCIEILNEVIVVHKYYDTRELDLRQVSLVVDDMGEKVNSDKAKLSLSYWILKVLVCITKPFLAISLMIWLTIASYYNQHAPIYLASIVVLLTIFFLNESIKSFVENINYMEYDRKTKRP